MCGTINYIYTWYRNNTHNLAMYKNYIEEQYRTAAYDVKEGKTYKIIEDSSIKYEELYKQMEQAGWKRDSLVKVGPYPPFWPSITLSPAWMHEHHTDNNWGFTCSWTCGTKKAYALEYSTGFLDVLILSPFPINMSGALSTQCKKCGFPVCDR